MTGQVDILHVKSELAGNLVASGFGCVDEGSQGRQNGSSFLRDSFSPDMGHLDRDWYRPPCYATRDHWRSNCDELPFAWACMLGLSSRSFYKIPLARTSAFWHRYQAPAEHPRSCPGHGVARKRTPRRRIPGGRRETRFVVRTNSRAELDLLISDKFCQKPGSDIEGTIPTDRGYDGDMDGDKLFPFLDVVIRAVMLSLHCLSDDQI